jgi:hypothetical protein
MMVTNFAVVLPNGMLPVISERLLVRRGADPKKEDRVGVS